jgi:uncharacterized cupin superfamily protein
VYNLFISYRREDTIGIAGRIDEKLAKHFGRKNVFIDHHRIPPGVEFAAQIRAEVGKCAVLLALIGDG